MKVYSSPFWLPNILVAAALLAAPAPRAALAETADPSHVCVAPAELTRLDHSLANTAKRIADGEPLTIVAIGSSSTAGAGASTPAHSYPSRLEAELKQIFPRAGITVVNRGVNGEETRDMLARFDRDVLAEKPHLVLWQVGTNAVLRDHPLTPAAAMIHEGVARLKAAGTDIVLIDPQFAPKVLAKVDADGMVGLIAAAAKKERVDLFRRFAVMRHWRQAERIPYEAFLSPDELHMNDWGYGCIARLLAGSIAEAARRGTVAVTATAR